jgi:alkanesulfonate monooxygenase SsuD/methylene tetrahydromethanopterin reductase-like flavin-dependent oxidoreductase (luciferase family)
VAAVQLGYLTHVAGHGSPAAVYRDTVALAVAAEELGLDAFWVAQHHHGSLRLLPSPLVLLAAIAERTSVIRLGTAVIAAPLEDPLRLAEDAAVLDTISGGRLELGLGAGADAEAAAAFGRDHGRRHADCTAAVDQVCVALTGPALVPHRAGLRDRLWWATGSLAGIRAAALAGTGVISGRPAGVGSRVVDDLRAYRAVAARPRVALARPVHAGEDARAVLDRFRDDPVLPLADAVIGYTQPARAPLSAHVATLRLLAAHVRPALRERATASA